jgi:transposase
VIVVAKWPLYSPNLNPIETFWKYMKEFLQNKYGDYKFKNYEEQKTRIQEA